MMSNGRWGIRRQVIALTALLIGVGCVREGTPPPKMAAQDVERMQYEMAESLVANQAYNEAAPYLRLLLDQHPNHPRLHLLLGIVLREKGVYQAAEAELRLSLTLGPHDADTHNALGILLSRTGRYDGAAKAHQAAIALRPQNPRYYNDLGVSLAAVKKYDEAKTAFEQAVRLNPNDRRAFNNLGFVLGLMNREDEAYRAFAQAGSQAAVLTNLGYLKELQGFPAQARVYYERAIRAQREYAPALRNLRALEPGRFPDPAIPGDVLLPSSADDGDLPGDLADAHAARGEG